MHEIDPSAKLSACLRDGICPFLLPSLPSLYPLSYLLIHFLSPSHLPSHTHWTGILSGIPWKSDRELMQGHTLLQLIPMVGTESYWVDKQNRRQLTRGGEGRAGSGLVE